jgi:hypothetical protein
MNQNPSYPVYIISKGRWERRLTSRTLEEMRVPYKIVVEPQERDLYTAVIDPAKILVLPFSNLGLGGIPARNWVWDHAHASGAKKHWCIDDNIWHFYRLNHNKKIPVGDGTCFHVIEDFCDRYENVALAGINYQWLCKATDKVPPYYLNTRIYSCLLIQNDLPFRWRGRYNEDTDLSLRVMKAGLCTILFNAFLCGKASTMTMKGGNTDELYKDDGRLKMAESLVEQHPDCVTRRWKFGRWQHYVDYRQFKKNKLIRKANVVIPERIDNYGMVLRPAQRRSTLSFDID